MLNVRYTRVVRAGAFHDQNRRFGPPALLARTSSSSGKWVMYIVFGCIIYTLK